MNKNKNIILIIVLTNLLTFSFTYTYMYLKSNQNILYQNISDRYYYLNYLLTDGEIKVLNHISKMSISDIIAIGEDKIHITKFSNTYDSAYLCAGEAKSSKHILLKIFDEHYGDITKKNIFLLGLEKISDYCKEVSSDK